MNVLRVIFHNYYNRLFSLVHRKNHSCTTFLEPLRVFRICLIFHKFQYPFNIHKIFRALDPLMTLT